MNETSIIDSSGSTEVVTDQAAAPAPFVDSAAGDIGPVENQGYVDPVVDNPDNDLLDEESRDTAMQLPEGID